MFWLLRSLWCILHVFLNILELRIENKTQIFRENYFENVVSDLWGETTYASTKLILEKSSQTKNN